MRIVIDMQGLQTLSSGHRGVGRYTKALVSELLKIGKDHQFYLAMNGAFPEAAIRIRKMYSDLIPSGQILLWEQYFDASLACNNDALTSAAEILRETFLNFLKPDIIFSTNLQEGLDEPACASVKRVKTSALYCTTLHDVVPLFFTDYVNNDRIRNWYVGKLEYAKQSDVLITVSHMSKSDIVRKMLAPSDAVHVVENGYDQLKFNNDPANVESIINIKNKYEIKSDFILYYGGADKHKNLVRLIQAFMSIAPDDRKDTALVLAGREVAYDPEIRCVIDTSGISDTVLTPGFVDDDDLPGLIKGAKAFVFPSLHEGFGLPALEAMACGTPVIGSAQSSIAEIIDNPAATFDPRNLQDMAGKIESVLNDDDFRLDIITKGLERASHYSWRRSARKLLDIFERHADARTTAPEVMDDPIEFFLENFQNIAPALDKTDLVDVAQSVAATFTPARRNKVFLDVSTIVSVDHRSGIQRVTRAIFMEFLRSPPDGFDVEIVYTKSHDLNFYVANRYLRENFIVRPSTRDDYVDFMCGDILIYLDLNPAVAIAHKDYNLKLRAKGVGVYHVVYDLIPILRPETFWPELCREFGTWLETISASDGALCISRSVASDLNDYISRFGDRRDDAFHIGWFHLGADIDNSAPTMGLPSNAADTFAAMGDRPTFLTVGTIEPRKGHRQVLAAFDQLWESGVDVVLAIFGRVGWLMDDFVLTLKNHEEFGKRLFWVTGGSDEYLEEIYKRCACLIAASDAEGFGLPLIEAAQHDIPIIARDIPVFREVAGPHAVYFKNGPEPSVIANSVRAWLSDRASGLTPKSSDIPWLTWRQSAAQMFDVIHAQKWSYEPLAKGTLRPYSQQDHRSTRLIWKGFSPPERDRRWSMGTQAAISFSWGGSVGPAPLRLQLSTLGAQRIDICFNDEPIFSGILEGENQIILAELPDLKDGTNVLTFLLPDARSPGSSDGGAPAFAIHSLMISSPLTPFEVGVDHSSNSQAIDWTGFGSAEDTFRWTDGHKASSAIYWSGAQQPVNLSIRLFALGEQHVTIMVNGDPIFNEVIGPVSSVFELKVNALKLGYNSLSFDLPHARVPGSHDGRLLGVALQSIRIDLIADETTVKKGDKSGLVDGFERRPSNRIAPAGL